MIFRQSYRQHEYGMHGISRFPLFSFKLTEETLNQINATCSHYSMMYQITDISGVCLIYHVCYVTMIYEKWYTSSSPLSYLGKKNISDRSLLHYSIEENNFLLSCLCRIEIKYSFLLLLQNNLQIWGMLVIQKFHF